MSVKQCVDRILEQYEPLKAYFTGVCFEDPSYTTQAIEETMQNSFTKIYLEFMSYILGVLCDFNVLFQGEESLLYKLKPEVEKILKDVCMNFMQTKYVKNASILTVEHTDQSLYLPITEIYLGISVSESIKDLQQDADVPENDINYFFQSIQNFYIELVTIIKDKFDFTDVIFDIISVVDPAVAQEFKIKSLQNVLVRFPILKSYLDPQELDNEWRKHSFLDHLKEELDPSKSASEYWKKVFRMKTSTGLPAFTNLKTANNLLLILPFSNASVERIFSTLNNCKTAHRSRLKTDTIVSLIAAKDGIKEQKGCVNVEPSKEMLKPTLYY